MITDGPVGGLSYQTASRNGVTNGSGEFEYLPGETVQFSVGGIEFPPVAAGERVTPLDMAGTGADLDDPVVVNILRLLQTLDADGDPDNGITIAPAVAEALEDVSLDFSAPNFETAASTAVTNTLNRPLVATEQAVAHFQRSLKGDLLGSWVYTESNGNINVLTFIDDSTYLIAHSQDDGDEQIAASVEYGRYSWDPVTGAFAVTAIIRESDGSGGLSDMQEGGAKLVQGETRLTFTVDGESFSFNAVPASDSALTGAWTLYEAASDNLNVLTFYTPTDYVVAHTNNQESYSGQPAVAASSEWGSYTWSASTGAFSIGTILAELDGDGGLYNADSDAPAEESLLNKHPNGDLHALLGDESVHFSRLGSFQVTQRDQEGDTRAATLKRSHALFANGAAGRWRFDSIPAGTAGAFDAASTEHGIQLVLNTDDSGSLTRAPGITNSVTWSVSSSGVLHLEETETAGNRKWLWKVTPVASQSSDGVLVAVAPAPGQTGTTLSFLTRWQPHTDAPADSLAGTWYTSASNADSEYDYVLFILDDSHYATIDYDAKAGNGGAGALEVGTYSVNPATGALTVTHSFRNESALDEQPPFISGRVVSVAGDVLNLTGEENFQLSRLRPTQGSPLKGGWAIGESGEQAFLAFTEGYYFMAEHAEAGEGGMSGIELGSYEYDLATKEVLFETLIDLNGEWGFSHPCAVQGLPDPGDLNCGPNGAAIKQTLTVDGDTLIFVSEADTVAEGEEQPIALQRVGH